MDFWIIQKLNYEYVIQWLFLIIYIKLHDLSQQYLTLDVYKCGLNKENFYVGQINPLFFSENKSTFFLEIIIRFVSLKKDKRKNKHRLLLALHKQ